mmetsp:Transcript_70463/g.199842  ORF Transcript_70463/g.199842 Transcript_70463/m.199842 type:complete len:666 (-) Transcript_70463:1884-3881(-)
MSGGVYDVFQSVQFTPQEVEVPDELEGTVLKLKPSDGEAIELEAEVACMADKVKQMACQNGPDTVIDCPIKKAILSKAIEYMKYHQDTPPAEITTPLTSDNIADCGVSKWDVSFIKVDREQLFELMYAAGALGIRSLSFLCCMQVSLSMKGKTGDKLRKDFNMTNDLPGDEQESLAQAHGELLARRRFPMEEGSLDVFAAVLHGVGAAAEKNGGLSHGAQEAPQAASVNLKSWRANSWRAVVMEDWKQLFSAPDEVKADRELMFTALDQSRGWALHVASESLKADPTFVLQAVKFDGAVMEAADDSLRSSRDFMLEAIVAGDGTALLGAAESLKEDRQLVLAAAARGKGSALKGASESLRADQSFVVDVVAKDPVAMKYASDELLMKKDFMLAAATRNGKSIQYMPDRFRADHEVATAAVGSDPSALEFVHAARRSEMMGGSPVEAGSGEPAAVAPGPIYMGVPLTAEAANAGLSYVNVKMQKYIMFTALSTITPNMGQANYIAANAAMDKMPQYSRPETDTVGIMWGTVGGMGMRFKAFASQDFMNLTPHLLLSIDDCCKILFLVSTRMDTPEWFAANYFDEGTRAVMLSPTAGVIQGENVAVTPSPAGREVSAKQGSEKDEQEKERPRRAAAAPSPARPSRSPAWRRPPGRQARASRPRSRPG